MSLRVSGPGPRDRRAKGESVSCDECDKADDELPGGLGWYIRVGRANVRIVGCKAHVEETMNRINGTPGRTGYVAVHPEKNP
jgi:hypothetical protein